MNTIIKRLAAATLAIGAVLQVPGTFAQWSTDGSGDAYVAAATAHPLSTVSAVAQEHLYPGGTGNVTVKVRNPNVYPVTLVGVDGNGPITSSVADCDAVSFTPQIGSWTLPAERTTTLTLKNAAAMSADAPATCQGATFTIPVALRTAGTATPTTTSTSTSTTSTTAPTPPALAMTPDTYAFGWVRDGEQRGTAFTVTNNGGAMQSAPVVQLTGGPFVLSHNGCAEPLAAGASCQLGVTFRPGSGSWTGTLRIDAGTGPVSSTVTGTGATPNLQEMPPTLNFGPVAVGTTAVAEAVITNPDGVSTYPMIPVTDGVHPGDFEILEGCTSVAANSSCTLVVAFTPTATGARSARTGASERSAHGANAGWSVALTGTGS